MRIQRIWGAGIVAVVLMGSLQFTQYVHAMEMPATSSAHVSLHRYTVPPITLTDQHDKNVRLDRVLADNKPVLVQFFFTACTTICGVRSAQLCWIAPKLAAAGIDIAFYSISIDPEQDTPAHLLAYSRKFGTVPPSNWHLLTGSPARIKKVQAAFDASDPSGDRMMHKPLIFIRNGKNSPWVRIDGMVSAYELMQQIKAIATKSS